MGCCDIAASDMANSARGIIALNHLASGKSMRCSFSINGIPAKGPFTVVTNELMGYGTTVEFLAGIFAPAGQFDEDTQMLIDALPFQKKLPEIKKRYENDP